jgi:MoxR-like ATPase
MDGPRILELREILEKVVVADPVRDFAVRLVLATHPQAAEAGETVRRFVRWGASPRAVQALVRAARVRALADGRAHVAFEDIRHFAPEVLGHRILLNYDGLAENLSVPELVDDAARTVPEEAA